METVYHNPHTDMYENVADELNKLRERNLELERRVARLEARLEDLDRKLFRLEEYGTQWEEKR